MRKIIFFMLIISNILSAQELLIVANEDFPQNSLSIKGIKAIFLDKRHYLNNKKILVMNYHEDNILRNCFEKNFLKKSNKSLERYWRKAYYQGKHPPMVIESIEKLFFYLNSETYSIGYINRSNLTDRNVTILHSLRCNEKLV